MTVMAAHESASDASAQSADLLQTFLALDVPQGFRAELIEGEIVVSPPPDGERLRRREPRAVREAAAAARPFGFDLETSDFL